ncbi:MAG: carboxymuconolactone decarboxylase family protein [Myxococcota bacterium]
MAWIETISRAAATGVLARVYESAVSRAGKIYNIVSLQSQQPDVLRASMQLYARLMEADAEPLSRAQREMIATAVSRANGCEY